MAFIVVMSHGANDCVQMDDMNFVDIYDKFVYAFADDTDVREIPKIFLFNVCRDKYPSELEFDPVSAEPATKIRNTLLLFSTIPNKSSARHKCTGSVYLTEFAKILGKHAKERPLADVLVEMSQIRFKSLIPFISVVCMVMDFCFLFAMQVFDEVQKRYKQTTCYKNIGFKNLRFFNSNE